MIQKYIQLLQDGIAKLTNLGNADATIFDYFQAVGYELLILLIGTAYITALVAVIAVPVITIWRIYQKCWKESNWVRYDELEYRFAVFTSGLRVKCKRALNCKLSEVVDKLKTEKGIRKLDKDEEIIKLLTENGIKTENAWKVIDTSESFHTISEKAQKYGPETFGIYSNIGQTGKYRSFKSMRFWAITKTACAIGGFVLIYLVFMIPFILMFIR